MTLVCICYFDNNFMLRTGHGGLLKIVSQG